MKIRSKHALRLSILIVVLFGVSISCSLGNLSISARIGDFLDDLGDENYGSDMASHFHPDAEVDQFNDSTTWNNQFNASNTDSYSWSEDSDDSRSSTTEYDGKSATRVSGQVTGKLTSDGSTETRNVRFVMREDGGNWLIRAIEVEGDADGDATIQNVQ